MSPINLDDLGNFNSLDDLNKALAKRMQQHNQGAKKDFEGLSPEQMRRLQVDFPERKSPLKLNKLSDKELEQCPLLCQVRFLIDKMKGGKTLKLTQTGALNTKLVKELYDQEFLKNEMIEEGISKLYKESDAMEIEITAILLKISGLAKKRREKMSLTKTGESHADDGNFILRKLLWALFQKFNWAYFDRYFSEEIGRINSGFSLYLLKKFGDEQRNARFYAEKYLTALPMLRSDDREDFRAYEIRTMDRYFHFMGFVEKEKDGFLAPIYVKKTAFFDKLIALNKN